MLGCSEKCVLCPSPARSLCSLDHRNSYPWMDQAVHHSNLHVCLGSQCLLIPELDRAGQVQGHLNGSHTIQQIS